MHWKSFISTTIRLIDYSYSELFILTSNLNSQIRLWELRYILRMVYEVDYQNINSHCYHLTVTNQRKLSKRSITELYRRKNQCKHCQTHEGSAT